MNTLVRCSRFPLVVAVALGLTGAFGVTAYTASPDAVLRQMKSETDVLEKELAEKREVLGAASLDASQSQADLIQAKKALGEVEDVVSYFAQDATEGWLDEFEEESKMNDNVLENATRDTSEVQTRLLDIERRMGALETALKGQQATDRGEGNSFPTTGWGGSGTTSVSAEKIDMYLESKGSPMAGSGEDFMRAGYRWNIDPRFVIAIAGAESYFGVITCASHNAWGWACPSSPVAFRSWGEGAFTVAKGLRENYLDEGRTSVVRVHSKYAPVGAANDPNGLNYSWANNVAKFLVEQGGNPNNISGPRVAGAAESALD